MDYNKLTKAELIEKLEEQKHLAQAVEAKDKEISELKKGRDANLKDYEMRLSELRKEIQGKEKLITPEKHNEEMEKVWKDAQEAIDKANLVLQNYSQFLTLINSAMSVINQNDKYMSEKIK